MLLIAVYMAAGVGPSGTAASPNPIGRSSSGELQCFGPVVEKKTCESIASYERTGPATYLNTELMALGDDVTLERRSPVVIKGDAVCGVVTRQDILASTLRHHNHVIPSATAKPLLGRVADAISPLLNKEFCTRYEQLGANIIAKSSLDGAYQPDKDTSVKWIAPSGGYTVAEIHQAYRAEVPFSTPELEAKWLEWARCGMTNGGYGFSWAATPYGIYILAVAPSSRAEAAGLKKGQQVLEVNGKSTLGMSKDAFRTLIHSRPAAGFDFKFHDASDVRLPPL